MKKDLEWLKEKIKENSRMPSVSLFDNYGYYIKEDDVKMWIDQIADTECNWKPSEKPNLNFLDIMMGGEDIPKHKVREMFMDEPIKKPDKTKAILASLKYYQDKYVESKKEFAALRTELDVLQFPEPPSSNKPNLIDGMINGGDLPIQHIRDMIGGKPSPSSQKQPPLNPKAILHSNITAELNAIYIAKNSDYGDAFGETYKKLGIISAVTRITDKVNRLQSLATKSESERLVKDESIRDTLMDLSNYAILTLIEMDIEKGDD